MTNHRHNNVELIHEAKSFCGKTFDEFWSKIEPSMPHRLDVATVKELLAIAWDAGGIATVYEDPAMSRIYQEIAYLCGKAARSDEEDARMRKLMDEFKIMWGDCGLVPVSRQPRQPLPLP